jgi:hypothetical protein
MFCNSLLLKTAFPVSEERPPTCCGDSNMPMKARDLFVICPLLALAVVCYFIGYRHGWREEKKVSTEFNIQRSLRVLREAERGDISKITNGCRMYLLGHTRAYEALVSESEVPDSFRGTFAEARQIAREVQTNLVVFDPKSLGK